MPNKERKAVLLPHYPASPLSQTAATWGFTLVINAHAVVYPLVITGYTHQSISHHPLYYTHAILLKFRLIPFSIQDRQAFNRPRISGAVLQTVWYSKSLKSSPA